MGLIPAIISGAVAIVSAAVVKVIADDAKEWTPWVTRHLLDIAVRRLPEAQQERYAEEWAAHLAEVPGVLGKLAVSLQFQIAAFWARELDAKARLDTWRNEEAAALPEIKSTLNEALAVLKALSPPPGEADKEALLLRTTIIQEALNDIIRRGKELDARRPALGITVAGAALITGRLRDRFWVAWKKWAKRLPR